MYICSRCGKSFDPFVFIPHKPVVMDLDTGEIQPLADAGLEREELEEIFGKEFVEAGVLREE